MLNSSLARVSLTRGSLTDVLTLDNRLLSIAEDLQAADLQAADLQAADLQAAAAALDIKCPLLSLWQLTPFLGIG